MHVSSPLKIPTWTFPALPPPLTKKVSHVCFDSPRLLPVLAPLVCITPVPTGRPSYARGTGRTAGSLERWRVAVGCFRSSPSPSSFCGFARSQVRRVQSQNRGRRSYLLVTSTREKDRGKSVSRHAHRLTGKSSMSSKMNHRKKNECHTNCATASENPSAGKPDTLRTGFGNLLEKSQLPYRVRRKNQLQHHTTNSGCRAHIQ